MGNTYLLDVADLAKIGTVVTLELIVHDRRSIRNHDPERVSGRVASFYRHFLGYAARS